jgi:hypothetical protein
MGLANGHNWAAHVVSGHGIHRAAGYVEEGSLEFNIMNSALIVFFEGISIEGWHAATEAQKNKTICDCELEPLHLIDCHRSNGGIAVL